MSKLAQAVIEESANDSRPKKQADSNTMYLKHKKEAEIRMKLDEFARELSQARANRGQH